MGSRAVRRRAVESAKMGSRKPMRVREAPVSQARVLRSAVFIEEKNPARR